MTILIALIFHKLGHYIPSWISKEKINELRTQFKWRQVLFEMSGSIMNFIMAFLLLLIVNLSSKEKYLLNENAIYGIEFSDVLKEIGFENGDRIISINNKKIVLFSDIITSILLETSDVTVMIQRGNSEELVNISDSDKLSIIQNKNYNHLTPILRPDSISDISMNFLKYEERQKGIKDAYTDFSYTIKLMLSYFSPTKGQYNGIGGYIAMKPPTNFKGYLFILATQSILIGLINLIPFPGLDVGNTIIALIEKKRKRKFNTRKLKIIRIVCSILIIPLLLLVLFFLAIF
jgi:membrane-associated protease RseP (regulator of RpoE activity)